jgi:hypothetical protein
MTDSFPKYLQVNSKIFMNNHIAHITHFMPRDILICSFNLIRDMPRGFPDNGDIIKSGPNFRAFPAEFLKRQIL